MSCKVLTEGIYVFICVCVWMHFTADALLPLNCSKWPIISDLCVSLSLFLPGAGEVHVSPGPKQGDGKQRPADSQQVPAHPRQGPVSEEPAAVHQGTDPVP